MLDPNDQYWWAAPLCYKNVRMSDVFGCTAFLPFQDVETRNTKVIKEKWGQYFANDHFCTPLCSKRNGNLVIKKFLEQKFTKSLVVNLVPNIWFNERNAIKKVRVDLVNWYCQYFAYMTLEILEIREMGTCWFSAVKKVK